MYFGKENSLRLVTNNDSKCIQVTTFVKDIPDIKYKAKKLLDAIVVNEVIMKNFNMKRHM